MNKFVVLAVFALIGAGVADPLPGSGPTLDDIMEDMDENTAAAGEAPAAAVAPVSRRREFALFDDYCAESSSILKAFLRDKMNGASSSIYGVLFASFNELSTAVLEQQAGAIQEGTKMIETSSAASPATADRWTLYNSVKSAARHVYNTVIETASSQAMVKLAQLKELYSIETLVSTIDGVCGAISSELLKRLNDSLARAKKEIRKAQSSAPDAEEILGFVSRARIDSIGCKVTTRISYTSYFCDIVKIAGTNIYNALYSPPAQPTNLDD